MIRPSCPADLPTLRAFFADPGFNEQWGGVPLSDAEITAKYTRARSPDVECFLVERAGDPIGLIQYCAAEDGSNGGGIDLVLIPAARGQGIGNMVVPALVLFLQSNRTWHRITVDPDAANRRGVNFWTTVGFISEQLIDDDADRTPYWLMVWRD